MYAIFAASPTLILVCVTRVYPPLLPSYLSANGPKSLIRLASVLKIAFALRLADNVPSFPSVIILSATRLSSFAFGTVVSMRSCWMSWSAIVRNIAQRWAESRPSFLKDIPCLPIKLVVVLNVVLNTDDDRKREEYEYSRAKVCLFLSVCLCVVSLLNRREK
mgnify:CR=1 FL=1